MKVVPLRLFQSQVWHKAYMEKTAALWSKVPISRDMQRQCKTKLARGAQNNYVEFITPQLGKSEIQVDI